MIPKNIDFFRMAFPKYKLLEDGADKINSRIGVLNQLCYNDSLEGVVRGELPLESIDSAGKEEINRALHSFKIHTCEPERKNDLSNPAVTEGITIFQIEYMENQWENKCSERGKICKETLLAMNQALSEKWERELYFYYNFSGKRYKEYYPRYINDEDIESNIKDEVDIYATEGNITRKIGHWTPSIQGGIQHSAEIPFQAAINKEKICKAVIANEGNGYDAVNTYDTAHLSIGLYQWSWEELYNFLRESQRLSGDNVYKINFKEMFIDYGLDINDESVTENKRFIIDGTAYGITGGAPSQLKKLRFVFCFIKAAENENFRKIQYKIAVDRVDTARNVKVIGERKVQSYITSRLGVALVLDQHVNRPGLVDETVRNAVNAVVEHLLKQKKDNIKLSKLQERTSFNNCFNSDGSIKEAKKGELKTIIEDPNNWGDEEEELIIKEYIVARNNSRMTAPEKRAADIRGLKESLDLSDKRNSYV
jgi:hypothetical protein